MELEPLSLGKDDSGAIPTGIEPHLMLSLTGCMVAMTTGPVIPQMHRPKDLFIPFMLQGPEDLSIAKCG